MDFTREALSAAKKSRSNLIKKLSQSLSLDNIQQSHKHKTGELYIKLSEFLADDLDIVKVFAEIYSTLGERISLEQALDIIVLDNNVLKL